MLLTPRPMRRWRAQLAATTATTDAAARPDSDVATRPAPRPVRFDRGRVPATDDDPKALLNDCDLDINSLVEDEERALRSWVRPLVA